MDLSPVFKGYQLLGDSNMVRFSKYILDYEISKNEHGLATAGPFCVSGQGINELGRCVNAYEWDLMDNVFICIGTNDVKRLLPVYEYRFAARRLMEVLKDRNVIWMTVPPILRYKNSHAHITRIRDYNAIIFGLKGDYSNLTTIDSDQIFIQNFRIREDLFTRFFTRPKNQQHKPPRQDDIHFNDEGFLKIADLLNTTITRKEHDGLTQSSPTDDSVIEHNDTENIPNEHTYSSYLDTCSWDT